ncbi:hypothetical protein MTsPCn9_07360 [Croceitalea sp. MTPC9]|uniref:hypothetical protein n=1 Tax=unclassified Croceitalea TaxID=2632280 RepID=UPI002B39EA7F|nr:hypothetical protein MTsPCn6_01350 [Croceitalea sp. MTPC6]GMN15800.1 hypothetical protein MTsPCn9_07360 [Croceitalea sp. MTPC9]
MEKKYVLQRKFLIEGFMALLIALSPILYYSYKYLPIDKEVIDFYIFDVTANGFVDASTAIYWYLSKIIPILLLIIWFVTSKQWWYHAILIPLAMYSFQLFSAINTSDDLDENEILYVVAVSMVIIPVVYFVRIKLVDKYIHGIDLKAMDTELQILKAKEELRKEREKLEQRKETLSKKM